MKTLAILATVISCLGGFIFGYDTGFVTGILVAPSFTTSFGITDANGPYLKGTIVALLQAGCAVGALLINPVADYFGRRMAMHICASIFILGGILQVVSVGNVNLMIGGRFVAGLGMGSLSMLVPMYISEIAPKRARGRMGTGWQFMIAIGIAFSYWTDYIVSKVVPASSNQVWMIPVGIQITPALALILGMIFMPESPRWLATRNRIDDAKRSMHLLREEDEANQEINAILASIEEEKSYTGSKLKELMQPINLRRVFIACMMQFFQQWTGINAVNYYGPTIFRSIGIESSEIDILATGVYGIVKVVFVIVAFFLIDGKLGRRATLMIGSAIMWFAMYSIAIVAKVAPPEVGEPISGAGYFAILCIYIFVVGFEFSWGPITWVTCSEIFPNRIRAVALSLSTATNWTFNAIIGKIAPIMLANILVGTYFFFGTMAFIMGMFVFFFLPETKGVLLEDMDSLFKTWIVFNNPNRNAYTEKHSSDVEKVNEDISIQKS